MLGRPPLSSSRHRRAALLATAAAVPIALAVGLAVAALGSPEPVSVPVASAPEGGRPECGHLIAALPDRLGRLAARRVRGDGPAVAAWGSPAVVLRCGVAPPPRPVGQLVTLDGVDWTPREDAKGVTWTTVGRQVSVQVRFPAKYDSQGPLLATLSPAVRRNVPAG